MRKLLRDWSRKAKVSLAGGALLILGFLTGMLYLLLCLVFDVDIVQASNEAPFLTFSNTERYDGDLAAYPKLVLLEQAAAFVSLAGAALLIVGTCWPEDDSGQDRDDHSP